MTVSSVDEFGGLTFSNVIGAGEILTVDLAFVVCGCSDVVAVSDNEDFSKTIERHLRTAFSQFLGKQNQVVVSLSADGLANVRLYVWGRVWRKSGLGSLAVGPGVGVLVPLLEATGELRSLIQEWVDSAVKPHRLRVIASLRRGPMLLSSDPDDSDDSAPPIARQIRQHEMELRSLRGQYIGAGVAAVAFAAIAILIQIVQPDGYRVGSGQSYAAIALLFAGAAAICGLIAVVKTGDRRRELGVLKARNELAKIAGSDQEVRAQKLFQAHSGQIEQYYRQALSQRKSIFLVGILCIVAGFVIVGFSLYYLQRPDVTDKILVAILGAVGSILANFIGVVYLRMFSETVKSIGSFHDRLVFTHHLHFANLLTAQIRDPDRLDESLADLVQLAARQNVGSRVSDDSGDGKGSK